VAREQSHRVRHAIAGGARILECDVHLTADHDVAVLHDPTLDRTSSGTGAIARCTVADLKRARLRGPDGALTDDCVPTLREVLALAAPAVMALLVEMKTPGPAVRYERRGERWVSVPGARYEGLEQARARPAARGRASPSARSSSRSIPPSSPRCARSRRSSRWRCWWTATTSRKPARRRSPRWSGPGTPAPTSSGCHYTLCDAAVAEAAHAAGIAVGVFTVNDEATMRTLAGWGVDVIISDRADLVARLSAEA
jgi:glycerophosphoryl diester phosphodiesterase